MSRTLSQSSKRLLILADEAEAHNPQWAKGVRFALGWSDDTDRDIAARSSHPDQLEVTLDEGLSIVVDIDESASYVEDMWPDEVEHLQAETRAQLRAEIAKGVEGLHRYSFDFGLESDGEYVDRAAVLALIGPTDE